jgi:hypothetical protein
MFKTAFLFTAIAIFPPCGISAFAQTVPARVAEFDVRIEQQRQKNKALSVQVEKTKIDSIVADGKADRRIDSCARTLAGLSGQIAQVKISLSPLSDEIASLTDAKTKAEAERGAAAGRAHSVIMLFDPAVKSWTDTVSTCQSNLDLAKSDSVDVYKRTAKEASRLGDSLGAMEKSLAQLTRKSDSLSQLQKKLRQDSLTGRTVNDDSLAAATTRLSALRAAISAKDSAARAATGDLNASRSDSSETVYKYQNAARKADQDIKGIDSIVSASQDKKARLLRLKDKFQLDSAVETLTEQLKDFLLKSYDVRSASTGPEAEKAQLLDVYKGKLDNLTRDEAFSAMASAVPGKSWQEQSRQVSDQIKALQQALDSVSDVREKIVRDGVISGKQFQKTMKELSKKTKTSNDFSIKTSHEVINAKPRIAKMEQDSAAAVRRCESTSEKYHKTLEAVALDLTALSTAADSLTKLRDALKTVVAEREDVHRKQLDDAHAAVDFAAQAFQRAKAGLDTVVLRQTAAKNDSISQDREQGVKVALAAQALQSKQEEIRVKNSTIDALNTKLSKAKNDSISLAREKLEQQQVFGRTLAEQRRLLAHGEQAVVDLTAEREAAAAAPPPPSPAAALVAAAPPAAATPAPPVKKQSAGVQNAQKQLTKIYELVEKGNNAAAQRTFKHNRQLLEKNLDAEAFATIKMTIESLEQPASKPAEAAGASQPPTPAPSVPAEPAAPAQPPAALEPQAKTPAEPPAPQAPAAAQQSQAPIVTAPPPVAEPEEPRKPATVFISSFPPVAAIYMDGVQIGRTNVGYVKVTSGKHTMQFIKGTMTCVTEMTFIEGQNPAQVVKLPCGQ